MRVAANLFAAGQETTVRLLGSAVQVLAEDPELQPLLRADRDLIPNFVEESLRTESPVRGDFRMAKVPVTVGGVDLPAGTIVMLVNAAANRDPATFADPHVFDVRRANARHHVAFGRGVHSCPGAPLARAEAVVSLNRLLDRTTRSASPRSTTARRRPPVPLRAHVHPPRPHPAVSRHRGATDAGGRRLRPVRRPGRVLGPVPRGVRAQ